jgi:hypothetical protein
MEFNESNLSNFPPLTGNNTHNKGNRLLGYIDPENTTVKPIADQTKFGYLDPSEVKKESKGVTTNYY